MLWKRFAMVSLGLSAITAVAVAEPISYAGRKSCGPITNEIRFTADLEQGTVSNLRFVVACPDGLGVVRRFELEKLTKSGDEFVLEKSAPGLRISKGKATGDAARLLSDQLVGGGSIVMNHERKFGFSAMCEAVELETCSEFEAAPAR